MVISHLERDFEEKKYIDRVLSLDLGRNIQMVLSSPLNTFNGAATARLDVVTLHHSNANELKYLHVRDVSNRG